MFFRYVCIVEKGETQTTNKNKNKKTYQQIYYFNLIGF